MPLRLIIHTWPLAKRLPLTTDASVPVTRLSVIEALSGCWNVTPAPAPTEKLCQLMTAFLLCCTIVVPAAPDCRIAAEPATTVPPDGSVGEPACAAGTAEATASARPDAETIRPILPCRPSRLFI